MSAVWVGRVFPYGLRNMILQGHALLLFTWPSDPSMTKLVIQGASCPSRRHSQSSRQCVRYLAAIPPIHYRWRSGPVTLGHVYLNYSGVYVPKTVLKISCFWCNWTSVTSMSQRCFFIADQLGANFWAFRDQRFGWAVRGCEYFWSISTSPWITLDHLPPNSLSSLPNFPVCFLLLSSRRPDLPSAHAAWTLCLCINVFYLI